MRKIKFLTVVTTLALAMLACSLGAKSTPTTLPTEAAVPTDTQPPTPTAKPEVLETVEGKDDPVILPPQDEPVQLTGSIEVSNALIMAVYFYERFAMLEDLTGYIQRDYEYVQPLNAQILGPVTVNDEGEFIYTINLPAAPVNPLNDVDHDGKNESGVQVWQVVMNANYMDDPFLGEDESGGWSSTYSSARIDSENKNEVYGGSLLVWAPDTDQEFPTGFGDDGLLFTDDDPVGQILPGYSIVDLEVEPFAFIKESTVVLPLYEGEITVNDYSDMGWFEAFEALHAKVSKEYPFTELKGLDWEALFDEFGPRIEAAEAENDETAYFLALRDFTWSIPDGHVGMSFNEIGNQMFDEQTGGGFGLAVIGLDDGRVITSIVSETGPAAAAGIAWGAEILEWDGLSIQDALDQVVPWSMPFSTDEAKRVQQYRYLLRTEIGTQVEVTYKNPGTSIAKTATITAIAERDTFSATSVYVGYDFNALPIIYEILPSGYGYIKINTLSEDINLIIRLWEWALERMIAMEVPAIIIDLRQNSGGSPLGTLFAGYFVEERIDISRSYYFSDKSGEFETYGPPSYTEPDDKLYFDGQIGVLVGPACASACEDVAYVLSQLEQTRVFGFYASSGMYGEVARGQYQLPGDYSFQAPTGLDRDMQGEIIIEGTGVVPDVYVPQTEEAVKSQYVLGEDVVLDYAIENLSQPLGSGLVPEYPPKMGTTAEAEAAFQAQTSWLDDLVQETYPEDELSQPGRLYTYTVPLNTSKDVMWVYAWCTSDEASFKDNWSKIQLDFSINGQPVHLDDFVLLEGVFDGSHCRAYYTVLSDWTSGEHTIATRVTFTAPVNDGIVETDFPAGSHIYEYHVFIRP